MRSRLSVLLLLVSGLAFGAGVASAAVPEGSPFWVTPMVGYGYYSDNLHYPADAPLDNAVIYGLRFGFKIRPNWALEAGGAYGQPKELRDPDRGYDAKVKNAHGSLVYTPKKWNFGEPYIAASGGWVSYDSDVAGVEELHYGTFEQAIGWRMWMNNRIGLRLEGRNILSIPYKNAAGANKADQQIWAGLDFGFGGKAKDTDADGVPDKKDKCPGTPAGATVDATGCPTDSDGDGVYDGIDMCTGTPKGATVDAKGCPTDTDGDGVYDGLDKCANTPKGATVDAAGCPKDSDGDGVFDGLDQCPNTPAGATVDAKGCPTDSDGDGVYDGIDMCANTPAGLKVDATGCPIEVTEKETQLLDTGMIRLQGVNFETGKADLLPESFSVLDEVGTVLRKWPQLQIEVGGHTDARGSAASNQKLSEARAASVRKYLLDKFTEIKPDQLTAKGYGESKPVAPNNNALNMSKNRRVEFVVLNKDVLKKEIEKRRMLTK
jgi:outer membrane protein OmpA-like peptidoglycan-associated protein